jgi:hypothetical protein
LITKILQHTLLYANINVKEIAMAKLKLGAVEGQVSIQPPKPTGDFTKHCPQCGKVVGRTKRRCECGHVFGGDTSRQKPDFAAAAKTLSDLRDFLAQNKKGREIIDQVRSLVNGAGGWDGLEEALRIVERL